MNNEIKVSILCTAFNHKCYIRQCLDGFIMQETNFKFEVLIHDDASIDGTTEIIKEYEKKYPNIIKPIYQQENQYSRGVKINKKYNLPRAKGEYLAWCEGDDYWSDSKKLQKQVDFLDSHRDYSVCAHRVVFNNLRTLTQHIIPKIYEDRDYAIEEIIKGIGSGSLFQLSSIVMRRELYLKKPECFETKGFGDFPLYIYSAICGKFHVLKDVMSVYNNGTIGSWTERVTRNQKNRIIHNQEMIKMYERINKYYNYVYNDALVYAINQRRFYLACDLGDKREMKRLEYRGFYKLYKRNKRIQRLQQNFPWLYRLLKKVKR